MRYDLFSLLNLLKNNFYYYRYVICVILKALLDVILPKIKTIIISVDGNIGSGKSTLIKKLINSNKNYVLVSEPINEWFSVKGDNGKNVLQTFYDDKQRYAYFFQQFAYITRVEILVRTIKDVEREWKYLYNRLMRIPIIVITERSTLTDKNVFAKMLYADKCITSIEINAYHYWSEKLNEILNNYEIKNVIYVRNDPKVSLDRIKKRGRIEEKDISFEYLKNVYDYHEMWLHAKDKYLNILELDTNGEFEDESEESKKRFNNHIECIKHFIENIK